MFKEFKKFAFRGNMIDLAIGVIIGGAFGKIVTSLVDDIFMPLIGLLLGTTNFSSLHIVLREGENPLTLNYGIFIQNAVDFLIIAFVIFVFIKIINKFKAKEEEKPAALSKEAELLTEIKEILAQQRDQK